jgi:predicted DNA-binding protein
MNIFLYFRSPFYTMSIVMNKNTNTNTTITKVNSDATIPLRVPSSLKDALLILATKDDRSLSSYIKRVLEAHVANAAAPMEPASVAVFKMTGKTPKVRTGHLKAKARKK